MNRTLLFNFINNNVEICVFLYVTDLIRGMYESGEFPSDWWLNTSVHLTYTHRQLKFTKVLCLSFENGDPIFA